MFIGSSTEGLEFARAVRTLLAQDAEVTLWNEGFFLVGNTFIDSLVNGLSRFDFAAVVLTPDEITHLKKLESPEPFHFKKSPGFEAELRRLLSLGLIARRPDRGVRSLFAAGDDVHRHLEITERGRSFLAYTRQLEQAEPE